VALSGTNVELRFDDIVALTPIDVNLLTYEAGNIVVYYGLAKLTAILNTDYTLALDETTFLVTVTPKASLVSKINALIAADAAEENVIYVRRQLALTSDFTETDAFLREKISKEFDRTLMRIQQLQFDSTDTRTRLAALEVQALTFADIAAEIDTASAAAAAAAAAAALIASSLRRLLTADETWYVSTAGNDVTGNGTALLPWRNPRKAFNYILQNIDLGGKTAIIQHGDGTYTAGDGGFNNIILYRQSAQDLRKV
jgi:hypothetical protein